MTRELPKVSLSRRVLINAYLKLPNGARKAVRRQIVAKRQNRENQLLLQRLDRTHVNRPSEHIKLSPNSKDLSDPTLYSFEEYARGLLQSKRVITNRLHVALPSTALGTETFLIDSGYHKLRGVYERSLSENKNVYLVPADE